MSNKHRSVVSIEGATKRKAKKKPPEVARTRVNCKITQKHQQLEEHKEHGKMSTVCLQRRQLTQTK